MVEVEVLFRYALLFLDLGVSYKSIKYFEHKGIF